ncbi:copper oxidase [Sporolactobacillus sp. THM7-4]|nr:copper oxidase [Sporolactobacillus sp. THM7-4]
MGGFGGVFSILSFIFWAVVIYLIFVAIKKLNSTKDKKAKIEDDNLQIIKERYARGEINEEQYKKLKEDLGRKGEKQREARKKWIIGFWVLLTLLLISAVYILYNFNHRFQSQNRVVPLPIPKLLKDTNPDPKIANFSVTAQQGTKDFIVGKKSATYGYNGDYLGPVIRVHRGEKVNITVHNDLGEPTTVHWHGLEIPGSEDGGPHNEIAPGEKWHPHFTINQPAATLWYHPHLLQKTGEQVYRGLAGLFYVEDKKSDQLDIPKEYGKNDIPLIIQDRRFNKNGQMDYNPGMQDLMNGFTGDKILVNGAIQPQLKVTRGLMRLRVLNGSNGKTYNLHLSDSQYFYQIASDGGFLEHPVKLRKLRLAPGERAEILVNFSEYNKGHSVRLNNNQHSFMSFYVDGKAKKKYSIPAQLTTIKKISVSSAIKTRRFAFQGMGPMVNINGKQMDMNRIDEKIKLNTTEIWEITNTSSTMMGGNVAHTFHAHGVQFQVLSRNGENPPENERGWKDTILINPGETVKVITKFQYKGIFMYHCHILEHEDAGMMGQFQVQ